MNVKIKVSDLVYTLDPNIPVSQAARAVKNQAEQAGIFMPSPDPGYGYMIWRLPGEGWVSFSKFSDSEKPEKASLLADRLENLKRLIGDPELASRITCVPDSSYYYFRTVNGREECAMVGWAYSYTGVRGGNELEYWLKNRIIKQDVSLTFGWDGKLLSDQPFTINGIKHTTPVDGVFHVGIVSVGSNFPVVHIPTGRTFALEVVEGKARYEFDLTQYLRIEVRVSRDGAPEAGTTVNISFAGQTHTIVTDSMGNGWVETPLCSDDGGNLLTPQPICTATCSDKTLTETPIGSILKFNFNFESEKPEEPPTVPPVEEPETKPEPEFVTINLTDVLQKPLADIEFFLTTKKKKNVALHTDSNGDCEIPKEWFTPGEKMNIRLHLSKEYIEARGLEFDLKKRKKK